ncbi:GNAT family N-acetyltransferase [Lederbergia wuyishanensis]|uniref:Ribosomal protein S18 acetylase RimI-like enzyme n=1 Tax=Lederbergia wuyishanensis TaxID=1347903 RepID=A0ABU0D639_9BACI|nr:GNAT family N-acetyltransferase [Lederbergia wuyishanensis]MCJ8008725.1 GNAT family N-acetyltransferase [Lederbergia wuyishanensis]MDQ0343855.1 ribosomal protein S18 acetylase RimI-like enzyme [Lederbergia wuyishanensis]
MEVSSTKDYELIATLNKTVHELHVQLYPEYFKEYHFENVKSFFEGLIQKDNQLFLIIKREDEALGYAWIELKDYPENVFKKGYKSVYVHQLNVLRPNQGLGSLLMDKIYEIAKEQKIKLVELDYWADNHAAERFYHKQGFTKYREFLYRDL